jgi:serine/threonine protein kinase
MKCFMEEYIILIKPPFVDNNKTTLFKKIIYEEPNYNSSKISTDAVNLLKMLLEKNPKKRINPDNIPEHSFFKKIDFSDIVYLRAKPPFKPKIVNFI